MATSIIQCSRCGKSNAAKANNCTLCGSLFSDDSSPRNSLAATKGLLSDDYRALVQYAEGAHLTPSPITTALLHSPPPRVSLERRERKSVSLQLGGGAVLLLGALMFCSNLLGWFANAPTFSVLMMLIGGAVWRVGFLNVE